MNDKNNNNTGYKKYDLGEAIEIFAKKMEPYADSLTIVTKQKIANLCRHDFADVEYDKPEYSTDVIPYFRDHAEGLDPEIMAALDEFELAYNIEYSEGVTTLDRYALTDTEMQEIVAAFRAAEEGRFVKPSWCPDYIDDIDKMKAFVFAYMTDINYHSERKILEEKGVEDFAKVADLWLGDIDKVMVMEKKLLGKVA